MDRAPERIYMSRLCNGWSEGRESVHDTEYIRADLVHHLAGERAVIETAVAWRKCVLEGQANPQKPPYDYVRGLADYKVFAAAVDAVDALLTIRAKTGVR